MIFLYSSRDALAYIDPGSGSYLFQLIIAGLLGAGFAIKTFWKNIKSFCHRTFSKRRDQETDAKG